MAAVKEIVSVTPTLDRKRKLCDSDFSVQWLLDSLANNDAVFQKNYAHETVKEISAKDISDGKGMFSIVLKCELTFEDSDDTYTTVLKIPGTFAWEKAYGDKKAEEINFAGNPLISTVTGMHRTECDFYAIFAPCVAEILPRVHLTQAWVPGQHQGCLHMEDLSHRGLNMNYHQAMTEAQLRSVIDKLALFHRAVLVNRGCWEGRFRDQERMFVDLSRNVMELSHKFMAQVTKNDCLHRLFEDARLQKIISNADFIEHVFFQSHLDCGLPRMLVHSDLWSSNIMFKRDADGHLSNEVSAILDWQVVTEGNMMLDFVRLMLCSLEGDVRRAAEQFVFHFYLERLNGYLADDGMKAPYTETQLRRAYQLMFLAHLGHATMMPGAFFTSTPTEPEALRVHEARKEKVALRAQHVLEDGLRLLESGDFDQWL